MQAIDIIYQLIGIIAMICSFASFQFKKNKLFLFFQCISCALFSVQFYIVKAYVACMMNAICILRCIFYRHNKYKLSNKIFTSIFCLMFVGVSIVSAVMFKEKIFIVIPCCLASIASTIGISTKNNKIIQILQLSFVSPIWIYNGIFYLSIGGIISETLNIVSVIIALVKNKTTNLYNC